jgi:hypothetical protein
MDMSNTNIDFIIDGKVLMKGELSADVSMSSKESCSQNSNEWLRKDLPNDEQCVDICVGNKCHLAISGAGTLYCFEGEDGLLQTHLESFEC